jgi:hypothetical protein
MTQSTARSCLLILVSVIASACACTGGPQPAPPLEERDGGVGDAAAGFGGSGGTGGHAGAQDGGGAYGGYGGTGGTGGLGGAGGQGGVPAGDSGVPVQCESRDAEVDAEVDTADAGDEACRPEDASVADSEN